LWSGDEDESGEGGARWGRDGGWIDEVGGYYVLYIVNGRMEERRALSWDRP
jgi:hypothetical protein